MQTSYIYELTVGLLILVALFLWVRVEGDKS